MKITLSVFWQFFLLGWTSFGGPAAHIGYFHKVFVEKLNWIEAQHFAHLSALSQFLPGPGSSQLGFAIGLHRNGVAGAIAAFLGFTLPSFCIMFAFAFSNSLQNENWLLTQTVYGLKLLAVVIVFDAIITMFAKFCRTWDMRMIALLTALTLVLIPSMLTQVLVIFVAAIVGYARGVSVGNEQTKDAKLKRPWLLVFLMLLAISLLIPNQTGFSAIFADFYRAGSLVFGGGHVVLPLLQESVGSGVTQEAFLTGYALAQGIPGPMFTFAAYLGAKMSEDFSIVAALVATTAIFLPGFLLILACKEAWLGILQRPKVAGAASAINASVVGLLIAALIYPISFSAIHSIWDAIIVVIGLALIRLFKLQILLLIIAVVFLRLFGSLVIT